MVFTALARPCAYVQASPGGVPARADAGLVRPQGVVKRGVQIRSIPLIEIAANVYVSRSMPDTTATRKRSSQKGTTQRLSSRHACGAQSSTLGLRSADRAMEPHNYVARRTPSVV